MPLAFWDYFFLTVHTALIFFNLFGWVFRLTRRLNLFTLVLTGFCWLALGYWYGLGYCPLTDYHWQVLEAMGERSLPRSYITYLSERLFGYHPDDDWVDIATGAAFALALFCSVFTNLRMRQRARQS